MSARSAWTRGPPLSHLRLSTRNGGGQPATSQVKKLARLLYYALLLVMVSSARVGLAYPRLDEAKGGVSHVYFPTHYCNPLPEHELIRRMGPSFDPSRMATNEDSVKRSAAPLADDEETVDYGAGEEDGEDLGDEVEEELEEEGASDVDDESAFVDSAMGGERGRGNGGAGGGGGGDGGYGSNRDMADSEMANQDDAGSSRDTFTSTTQRPVFRYPIMRRRRSVPSDHVRSERDLKEVDDSLLPLQLLSNSKKKKLRKQLKQKLREKLNSRKFRKNPPWECKMSTVFEKTKADYFPKFVQTGRCETDKCFYRLYRCVPKKYRVTLMKRDPDHCVPIPTLSQNTTYEERWDFVRHYVIVGCDCKPKRRRQKK